MGELDLAKRIKQERESWFNPTAILAVAYGVGFKFIGSIERRKRSGSIPLINKTAQMLNVTIDYLVNGEMPTYVCENIKEIENYVRHFSEEDMNQVAALVKRPRYYKKRVKQLFPCYLLF